MLFFLGISLVFFLLFYLIGFKEYFWIYKLIKVKWIDRQLVRLNVSRSYSLGGRKEISKGLIYSIIYYSVRGMKREISKNKTAEANNGKKIQSLSSKPIQSFSAQKKQLTSKEKGDLFEKYVVENLDDSLYRSLKDWRSDKFHDGRFGESNTYPDLQFKFKKQRGYKQRFSFSIECKYRSVRQNSKYITTVDPKQLKRYRNFAREEKQKVFVVFGIGGNPSFPDDIYIVPLADINSSQWTINEFEKYAKHKNKSTFHFNLKEFTLN